MLILTGLISQLYNLYNSNIQLDEDLRPEQSCTSIAVIFKCKY